MTTPKNNITTLHPKPSESRDVRAEVLALLQSEEELSQRDISRESGVSQAKISGFLRVNGPYANSELVEHELAKWLDAFHERRRDEHALPEAPAWFETPTAKRVMSALKYAQMAADVSIIYGGAGVGKTETIRHYQATNPNVWIVTMTPATKTTVPALEEVAHELGLKSLGGGAARLQRGIVAHMRKSRGLLIIDEAQQLNVEALDAIRSLHDATEVGLALLGNETVYARMAGSNRAAYLDRLFSRIGKRLKVSHATRADVDALMAAWKIKDRQCVKAAYEIASRPGALRDLTKTLRVASLFALGAKRPIDVDDIRAAWRDRGGDV